VGVVPLEPVDVARAIVFALDQPAHCNVFEIALRPANQI
jgi:NADP-dependent 3-hydroxy acid dehydrogenase YdfG